jgi:single-strand DNA-binding protein
MVNKVTLIGHFGDDPELKNLEGGKMVAKFSLATSETWKDKDGKKQEQTEWHNCTAWGKQGELINLYCKKGSKLYIEGKITYRSYEKDGKKEYYTEIIVQEFKFLDSKGQSKPDEVPSNDVGNQQESDDLPF